jgi:aldose 1-epimerase
MNQNLQINADKYLVLNEFSCPTGEISLVEGTPFDFRKSHEIGLKVGDMNGYDNYFILEKTLNEHQFAARAIGTSGRKMEIFTSYPGVQLYTGNYLSKFLTFGKVVDKQSAFCLEAQGFPDAPNHENFPSVILAPGEVYSHRIHFRFDI